MIPIHKDSITQEKEDLLVIIYGPYNDGGLERLEALKQKLFESGYNQASLVKDLSDPPGVSESRMNYDLYATKKSKYWLRRGHVNLFVLFHDIPYGSVMVEIVHFLSTLPEKIPCASFLVEKELDLQTLEIGNLRDYNCNIGFFDNDDDLKMLARSQCLTHLIENRCIMMEDLR